MGGNSSFIKETISEALRTNKAILAPMHARGHWSLLLLSPCTSTTLLFDSAPSVQILRDVRHVLQVIAPDYTLSLCPSPRQVRGSEECGLFVVFNVVRLLLNVPLPPSTESISLSAWRSWLQQGDFKTCILNISTLCHALSNHHSQGGSNDAGTPLTTAFVSQFARNLTIGSRITAQWGLGSETGTWFGMIYSRAQPGLHAVVEWDKEMCPSCGEIKLMTPVRVTLPASGLLYYSLRQSATDTDTEDTSCTCDEDDESDEEDDEVLVHNPYQPARTPTTGPPEPRRDVEGTWQMPLDLPLVAAGEFLRGDALRGMHIFPTRPPHTHALAWGRYAAATRRSHIRWLIMIQQMPHDLASSPLGFAVVERILRLSKVRRWRPSTVARAFGDVATALSNLPSYTNWASPIRIRTDVTFAAAIKAAQVAARVTPPRTIRLMTANDFERIIEHLRQSGASPSLSLFLKLAWALAARVGDLRQCTKQDFNFDDSLLSVTYRRGKGPSFRGAYTVPLVLNDADTARLRAHLTTLAEEQPVFTTGDQSTLAKLLSSYDLECRSLRKGRLTDLALRGSADADLMVLSGHLRLTTLHRYIGGSSADLRRSAHALSSPAALPTTNNNRAPSTDTARPPSQSPHKTPSLPAPPVTTPTRVAQPPRRIPRKTTSRPPALPAPKGKHKASPPPPVSNDVDPLLSPDESDSDCEFIPRGGEIPFTTVPPPKMGPHSGRLVQGGQRTRKPPTFLNDRPPSSYDLGLSENHNTAEDGHPAGRAVGAIDPLHVKNVPTLNVAEVLRFEHLPHALRQQLEHAHRYAFDASLYPRKECTPLKAKFSESDIELMLSVGKIRVFDRSRVSLGTVKAFTVPSKNRRRPIFEPLSNHLLREAPPRLHYPSRLFRRRPHRFALQFDFAAYFDQLALSPDLEPYFTFACNGEVYCLTRMPMGSTASPALAQSVTWAIVAEANVDNGVVFADTMIDNIRLVSDDLHALIAAARRLLGVVARCGATLNDDEWFRTATDDDLATAAARPYDFLGEHYFYEDGHAMVTHTAKHKEKLTRAIALLDQAEAPTLRKLTALLSLIFYMSHTVNISLSELYPAMYTYRSLFGLARSSDWDAPLPYLAPSFSAHIREAANRVMNTDAVPCVGCLPKPPPEAIIVSDASASGWAALIHLRAEPTKVYCASEAFVPPQPHSANAEPNAIAALLRKCSLLADVRSMVVYTDHRPIVDTQSRQDGYGGYAKGFALNGLHKMIKVQRRVVDFRFVGGTANPADAPSRGQLGAFRVEETSMSCLPLPPDESPLESSVSRREWEV